MRYKIAGLAAAAIAFGGVQMASAADMAVKARPMMAPIATYTWTGCYIGGNVGGAWTKQDQRRTDQIGVGPAPADYGSETDSGFAGGVQVGCDYQFAGPWVVGIRGLFDWTDLRGSHALPSFPTFTMNDRTKWFGTATARLGYAVQPMLLAYVQGGAAWVHNEDTLLQPSGALSESARWTDTGWTVGGGLEWAFAPNWSIFGEYNFMDFGTRSVQFDAPPPLLPVGEHIDIRQTVHVVMFGINYRFHP